MQTLPKHLAEITEFVMHTLPRELTDNVDRKIEESVVPLHFPVVLDARYIEVLPNSSHICSCVA